MICSTVFGIFLVTAPFAKELTSIPSLVIERYGASVGQYAYASMNAFNFWSFIGKNLTSDEQLITGISYHHWGLVIFCAIVGVSFLTFLFKNFRNSSQYYHSLILLLAICYISIFTFATRVHERHLLTFFPLMAILVSSGWSFSITYIATSFIYVINLYFGILYLYQGGVPFDDRSTQLYSGGVVFFCLFLIFQYWYNHWFNDEKI